jgi:predicted N-acyltransferase
LRERVTDSRKTTGSGLRLQRLSDLGSIPPAAWNRLARGDSPFLSHEFLHGLERCGCFEGHGWTPTHLVVHAGETLVGAVPLYVKTNSHGEFVFDWSWAEAYEHSGGRYYPKLVSAIPFTPVRGPRLLIDLAADNVKAIQQTLLEGAIELARESQMSSLHFLFPEDADAALLSAHGLLSRKTIQFHWRNNDYRDFDDFLDALSAKKRKEIRRERRSVVEQGITVEILEGAKIACAKWDIFYEFYCSTFERRWGSPRFTREFFYSLSERLPRETLLILAYHAGEPIAGAFAMLGARTLYGRHWGCSRQFANLHFELCYYQTIDYCIRHKLAGVDAGVQGEHKLSRGFEPVAAWSCHWIRHPGFRDAIEDFLHRETQGVDAYIDELNLHLPYKQT